MDTVLGLSHADEVPLSMLRECALTEETAWGYSNLSNALFRPEKPTWNDTIFVVDVVRDVGVLGIPEQGQWRPRRCMVLRGSLPKYLG